MAGAPPKGFRAPYWALGGETLPLVQGAGFEYDSSLMADDYRPYRVRVDDRHSVDEGSAFRTESALVEVPVYWVMDDWPHFEPGPGATGCRRRRGFSRSGAASCATPMTTRREAC